jgi:NAD(P)H-dependent flavin oxidoreductase YrpB (nitropropane dioxygenase family)
VGSRFAASMESSARHFKKTIIENQRRRDTTYIKGIGLVRLIKNKFFDVQKFIWEMSNKGWISNIIR